MAITEDFSNRLMVFDAGQPIKDSKLYSKLKDNLSIAKHNTLVSSSLIYAIFSSIKDPFTGYTYATPSKVFEDFCRINDLQFRFNQELGDYIVIAKS